MDTHPLALHGGTPVRETPFPNRGHIGAEEKAAIDALFDRAIAEGSAPGYNGPEEMAYCEEFARWMGGGYVDAVSSGTAGIYVALKALACPSFSEVIIGAVTDPGGMMPIPLLNLIPIVADVVPGSFNTGPAQIEALISPLTSAILVPHIGGEPADIAGIIRIARTRNIPVIEDCSQAHAARLDGQLVGTFGDLAVFSTMFGKHHSTGGQGGVVFTQDEALYQRVRRASDRGKPFFLPGGTFNVEAALNLNLNDLAAAIGRVQLKKLPAQIEKRREMVQKIAEGIGELSTVSLPEMLPGAEPSYWFGRLRFHPECASCDKATYCRALQAEGLPVTVDYDTAVPHQMPWFKERRVFGTSGYPWTSPDYKSDPDRQFECPNLREAIARHFIVHFNEGWQDGDIADAIAILIKVDAAFAA